MGLTLPNPTSPTNGDSLDATPILANIQAIASAIQSFDGSQISSKSILEAALADAINPRLRASENQTNYIATGGIWSGDSYGANLNGSMTSGTVYINGYRTVVNAISAHAFTASKDTYVAVDYLGNVTYNEVTNGASAPSLPSNAIWLAKIVSGSSNIASAASVVQTGVDSNNVQIYPNSPYIPLSHKSYTPTFANTTLGNGTVSGKYIEIGKTVFFKAIFTLGSTSAVSSNPTVSLPITGVSPISSGTNQGDPCGLASLYDSSATSVWQANLYRTSTTVAVPYTWGSTSQSSGLGSTTPFTWATGDQIVVQGNYEAP